MSGDRVPFRTRTLMALRANLLQATWNFERQQGLGWAWALAPALRRLYPDRATRLARLAEHTAYFNTQPTLASLALGAVARLEAQRAESGTPDMEGLARIKNVLGSTLAALGDRLFWFSLRPFAAVLGVTLVFVWPLRAWGPIAFVAVYATLHLGVRLLGVHWGWRLGPQVLGERLRLWFERAVALLGWLGSALIGSAVALSLAPGGQVRPIALQCALGAGLALGLVSAQRARPSPTQWALGLGILGVIAAGWR